MPAVRSLASRNRVVLFLDFRSVIFQRFAGEDEMMPWYRGWFVAIFFVAGGVPGSGAFAQDPPPLKLMQRSSPVLAINRALAIAKLHGADAALDAIQEVAADARLTEYQPYWAARAELLAKIGALGEARQAYEIAIGLEREASVRRFLQHRQSALAP
jgi:ADP-ribose pyrophosphatase YjhB (NUDIX family)